MQYITKKIVSQHKRINWHNLHSVHVAMVLECKCNQQTVKVNGTPSDNATVSLIFRLKSSGRSSSYGLKLGQHHTYYGKYFANTDLKSHSKWKV